MATWAEVQSAVRTAYTLDNDAEHEFAVTLRSANGRAQRVMVRHTMTWGHSLAEFRSAFAQSGAFDANTLLADNLQLPLGSIALHGRFLVLVHKAILDFTSVEGVLFIVGRMGMLADLLEDRTGVDKF